MTCIVGVESSGKVWLGGDSACTRPDGELTLTRTPKVFSRIGWAFGVCGDGALDALLRYEIKLPRIEADLDKLVQREFVAALNKAATETDSEIEECEALIGVRGRLYHFDGEAWVAERVSDGYGVIGNGSGPALGVLFDSRKKTPRWRCRRALMASERHHSAVRRPFRYVHT